MARNRFDPHHLIWNLQSLRDGRRLRAFGRRTAYRASRRSPFTSQTGAFLIHTSAIFGILRVARSRASISYETPRARHTTNNAFTISQTSSHPVIPT